MTTLLNLLRRIFISPTEIRLRAGWRILLHFVLLALAAFAFGYIIEIYTILVGNLQAQLIDSLVSLLAITLSIFLARRWLDRRAFRSLGLHWDLATVRDLWVGMLLPGLLFGLILLIEWAFGWIEIRGVSQLDPPFWDSFALWIAIFLMVGWYEELLSRGYWLRNLADGINLPWAVFISSAVFSLLHLANPSASLFSVIGILAAGYFLAYPLLRTGQLWLSIGLHIGWNIFEGPIFGFPVSGLNTPGLLVHTVSGPEWLTGGAFGPEAGFVLLPALALGAYLINRYTQHRTPLSS